MIRIALMGDGAVGKTSLRKKFMGLGFSVTHIMTVGADFAVHQKEIEGNQVLFQIWDLAGQESYSTVRARFFRGAMAGLCIFDLTKRDSFVNTTKWIEELWRNSGRGVIPVIILANKADLKDKIVVKPHEIQDYANRLTKQTESYGFYVYYMETSAKNGTNVDESFDLIAKQVIDAIERGVMVI
ncbi:MAG: GTP-binding protein [Candidatus Kariarchaeaceae archaeon]